MRQVQVPFSIDGMRFLADVVYEGADDWWVDRVTVDDAERDILRMVEHCPGYDRLMNDQVADCILQGGHRIA